MRGCAKHDNMFSYRCKICVIFAHRHALNFEEKIKNNYQIIDEHVSFTHDETRLVFIHAREQKTCVTLLRLSTTHTSSEHDKIIRICTLIASLRKKMNLPAELAWEIAMFIHCMNDQKD
jgi:hypothetical protein